MNFSKIKCRHTLSTYGKAAKLGETCYVGFLYDELDRLVQMWVGEDPKDFKLPWVSMAAEFQK